MSPETGTAEPTVRRTRQSGLGRADRHAPRFRRVRARGSGRPVHGWTRRPFAALADPEDPRAWADLAALAGPGEEVWVTGLPTPPPGWETAGDRAGRAAGRPGGTGRGRRRRRSLLGRDDVPEMLELVGADQPGPFLDRTVELGTYLGIRHEGAARRDGRGADAAGRLVGDQRGVHPPGPPGPGPGRPADTRGRGGGPRARGQPVPARGGGEHRRRPALRVDGLHAAPPPVLPGAPHAAGRRPGA